jgi:hypothetical protein
VLQQSVGKVVVFTMETNLVKRLAKNDGVYDYAEEAQRRQMLAAEESRGSSRRSRRQSSGLDKEALGFKRPTIMKHVELNTNDFKLDTKQFDFKAAGLGTERGVSARDRGQSASGAPTPTSARGHSSSGSSPPPTSTGRGHSSSGGAPLPPSTSPVSGILDSERHHHVSSGDKNGDTMYERYYCTYRGPIPSTGN